MSRRTLLALGATAALALGVAGTLVGFARDSSRSAALVDDRSGAYRGVRVGDKERRVIRLFGKPEGGDGVAPAGQTPAEAGVPTFLPGPADLLKYEDVVFLLYDRRVYAFMVTEKGARTTRRVAIGDELDAARRAYRLSCTRVAGGESPFSGQEFYPSCRTTVSKRGLRMWFGRDPIRSVTIVSLRHAP